MHSRIFPGFFGLKSSINENIMKDVKSPENDTEEHLPCLGALNGPSSRYQPILPSSYLPWAGGLPSPDRRLSDGLLASKAFRVLSDSWEKKTPGAAGYASQCRKLLLAVATLPAVFVFKTRRRKGDTILRPGMHHRDRAERRAGLHSRALDSLARERILLVTPLQVYDFRMIFIVAGSLPSFPFCH